MHIRIIYYYVYTYYIHTDRDNYFQVRVGNEKMEVAESATFMRAMPLCTIHARVDKLILIWYQSIQVLMPKWKEMCSQDEMFLHIQWYSHESRRWYASIWIYSLWVHACNSLQRDVVSLYTSWSQSPFAWARMSGTTHSPDTCRSKRHVPFESPKILTTNPWWYLETLNCFDGIWDFDNELRTLENPQILCVHAHQFWHAKGSSMNLVRSVTTCPKALLRRPGGSRVRGIEMHWDALRCEMHCEICSKISQNIQRFEKCFDFQSSSHHFGARGAGSQEPCNQLCARIVQIRLLLTAWKDYVSTNYYNRYH